MLYVLYIFDGTHTAYTALHAMQCDVNAVLKRTRGKLAN